MNLRRLYVNDLIPAYSNMLKILDTGVIGHGEMLKSVKDVCDIFNNLVDYIAIEHPQYILDSWSAKNCKEFRENLEKLDHKIKSVSVKGNFFGVVRDIANTSKHLRIRRNNAQVNLTENIRESLAYIRFEDEGGYYYYYQSTVIASHVDGSKIPVELYLYLSFLSFSSMLIELNVIPNKPKMLLECRSFYVSRSEAIKKNNPSMEVAVGEPVNMILSSFVYHNDSFLKLRSLKANDEFAHTLEIDMIVSKERSIF